MPNTEHLAKLIEGIEAWNQWRESNPSIKADLSGAYLSGAKLYRADLSEADLIAADLGEADLSGAHLNGADLRGAHLSKANLRGADLSEADLSGAHLNGADLRGAHLNKANLRGADLSWARLYMTNLREADLNGADLIGADLSGADLSGANLYRADLRRVLLVETVLERADLTGCNVYGISVWNARLDGAAQSNLVVTPFDESVIQVDNLEVAQFVYLLLNNQRIRHVIDTITSKVVLILGRFTPERKVVLDAIREELRKHDYLPVLFDFDPSSHQTTMDTISTLAHMSRFIIADLTDAKSILGELERITTALQLVPVQLILHRSADIPPMGDSILVRQSVLKPYYYMTQGELIASIAQVIEPAAAKAEEFKERLAEIRKQYLPWQQPR